MPLVETIKEFDSFIPRGVDLIDHTSIFLLRTINHYVTLIMSPCGGYYGGKNSEEVPVGTNHESIRIIGITR